MVIICTDQGHIIIYGAAMLCATNLYNLISAMPCPAILDYQIQYCDHQFCFSLSRLYTSCFVQHISYFPLTEKELIFFQQSACIQQTRTIQFCKMYYSVDNKDRDSKQTVKKKQAEDSQTQYKQRCNYVVVWPFNQQGKLSFEKDFF